MSCKANFVQTSISSALKSLGSSVGRYPLPYCLLPILLTAVLSTGFFWLEIVKDIEYLYSPINGRSLREREAVEKLFPPSSYSSDIVTKTRLRGGVSVLLLPKDRSSVLREDIMEKAATVDRIIRNISISWGNKTIRWEDICLRTPSGICSPNDVLRLRGKVKDLRKKVLRLKFPTNFDEISHYLSATAFGLGGVAVDNNNYILDASVLRLVYLSDCTTAEKCKISLKWEEKFSDVIKGVTLQNVTIYGATSSSQDHEVNKITEMALPYLGVTISLMGTFATLSAMTLDCITSKPLVAVAGCISPAFGVLSAFGFLMIMGVPYIDINIAIPFLLIGIGLDDSFVLLAAWRRTDPKMGVEKRMSQSYSEAGPSITITSVTNFLSICAGFMSPYRIVRIYCAYSALSVVLSYVYQVTFFGSVLALSGIREYKGLHSVLFIPVKEDNIPDSAILRLVYFGCSKGRIGKNDRKWSETLPCTQYLLSVLLSKTGKAAVVGCFALYLTSSVYGLTFFKKEGGFDFRDAMPHRSSLVDYLNLHYEYFTQYPHAIQVVVNKTLDYSSKEVQDNVENMLRGFCQGTNMDDNTFSVSWLKFYLQSANNKKLWFAYYGYNISNRDDFLAALTEVFLKFNNTNMIRQYIRFNEDRTKIVSSRFLVASKNVRSPVEENRLLSYIWSKADSAVYPVYVHNYWFPIYDLNTDIYSSFKSTLLIATGLITIVFIIFIPNLLCVVCVSVTSLSIQCGVIGYMTLWNVLISPISLISVMISIGLCIDYSAHICYAYLSCREDIPDQKTKTALLTAGYPIIQGCISTLLGVVIYAFVPSNIFIVFFKIITLVMVIATFHGLLVIPIFLNVFDTVWGQIFSCTTSRTKGN